MQRKQLNEFRKRVSRLIDSRRLREAIEEIKEKAHSEAFWGVEDKIKLAEQNYRLMLQYLTKGMADPDRDDVYNSLVSDIYTLLDRLIYYFDSRDNTSLYYSTIRTDLLGTQGDRIPECRDKLAKLYARQELAVESGSAAEIQACQNQIEAAMSRLFRAVWTSQQITGDTADAIREIIAAKGPARQLTVSALTLALLQQYDRRKLEILMETYLAGISATDSETVNLTSAALVGMLLGLWKYSSRPLTRSLADRLNAIKENPAWSSDLRIAFIELIRARDTERINKKMRDELIPNMQKLRPDIIDRIREGSINPDDPTSLQENPEWEDLLNKSGVADQLKELTEMQMEGSDVMMSTFSNLKGFAFFNDIANWFMPFDPANTAVAQVMNDFGQLAALFTKAAMLCDSDKYSFVLSLTGMPQNMRDSMVGSLKSQLDGIMEQMGSAEADINRQESRRRSVNLYIQGIYRFFKLHPRRAEFFDPFNTGVNLIAVPALTDDFGDEELLQVVAEFYFKLRYMQEAIEVFGRMKELSPGDAPRYQKMGYCHERLGQYGKAVEYYERADLLDGDSAWTLRRLASCHRALGHKADAINYYRRLAELQPDNLKAAMLYGQALTENGEFREAIHQFYKVEFLDESSTEVWRPLAWALFLTGDFDGASRYYRKIVLDKPSPTDYLNMGHVALATGNMREAVNNYSLSIQESHNDKEWFINTINADSADLVKAGVDISTLPLIIDAALYEI